MERWGVLPLGFLGFAIVLFVVSLITAVITSWNANDGLVYISAVLLTIALVVVAVRRIALLGLNKRIDKGYVTAGMSYSYECELCGYNWLWASDQPKPSGPAGGINTRLMELGQDLNREQQAQRAAAAEYERQRRDQQRRDQQRRDP
jgi:hypothetical protein